MEIKKRDNLRWQYSSSWSENTIHDGNWSRSWIGHFIRHKQAYYGIILYFNCYYNTCFTGSPDYRILYCNAVASVSLSLEGSFMYIDRPTAALSSIILHAWWRQTLSVHCGSFKKQTKSLRQRVMFYDILKRNTIVEWHSQYLFEKDRLNHYMFTLHTSLILRPLNQFHYIRRTLLYIRRHYIRIIIYIFLNLPERNLFWVAFQ